MVSDRLRCLAQLLQSLAVEGEPVPANNVALAAIVIETLLPHIEAMENAPVPARWRVVNGGKQ